MTEKQLEKAARELCKIRGEDPEQRVNYEGNQGSYINSRAPRWYVFKEEIENHLNIEKAIRVGRKKD